MFVADGRCSVCACSDNGGGPAGAEGGRGGAAARAARRRALAGAARRAHLALIRARPGPLPRASCRQKANVSSFFLIVIVSFLFFSFLFFVYLLSLFFYLFIIFLTLNAHSHRRRTLELAVYLTYLLRFMFVPTGVLAKGPHAGKGQARACTLPHMHMYNAALFSVICM